MACRVAIDILAVELYRADRKHLRTRSRRVLDHDVEVDLLGHFWIGQVDGRLPGARWNAGPEVVSLTATTTQSSS